MSTTTDLVWRCEHSVETTAPAAAVWELWTDVGRWSEWNPGVAHGELDGLFREGAGFATTLPDGTVIRSTLHDVIPGRGFADETSLGETTVWVAHRIEPAGADRRRITCAVVAVGAEAAAVGAAVSADFPVVLRQLAERAEWLAAGAAVPA